ncbi:hypothetical protein O6H91_08G108700 [Diphasiastrum complanatum]|uniref:Uncharacterized protein n=1 Tax=Diphasiastrum complanatum TaxID=34168 RepID=A0ACC2D192_DIPCM|nr:hypothetical protein O6H91_08G108700 [Diphasiastrum complanatum]
MFMLIASSLFVCWMGSMMGQQKRPLEVDISPQLIKCVKPFTSSRCKEAGKWLEANSEIAEESSEQLNLDHIRDNISGSILKEPTLQEELLSLQTCKIRDLNVAQVGASTGCLSKASSHNLTSNTVSSKSKSPVQSLHSALLVEEDSRHSAKSLFKETIHTTQSWDFETPFPKDVASKVEMGKDVDAGNTRSEEKGKLLANPFRHNDLGIECGEEESLAKASFMKIIQKALQARKMKMCRPLPVIVGDKEVDLFLLSRMVKDVGGYTKVTDGGSWRKVSEGLGFGPDCGPCLKLIYVKYLKLLESGKILGLTASEDLTFDQEISAKALNNKLSAVTHSKGQEVVGSTYEEMLNVAAEYSSAVKSKQDPLVGAFKWIKRVASNPADPKRGQGPKLFQKNEHWVQYCATLASSMRTCLWNSDGTYSIDIADSAHLHP